MTFSLETNSWLPAFPAFPAVAIRVLELFSNTNAPTTSIANEIKCDPAMTASLLRIANSPLYGSRREITTVEHALSWLGRSEVVALVLSMSINKFAADSGSDNRLYREFWKRSFVQGCAMSRIGKSSGRFSEGEGQVCGLLLDFGVLMFLNVYASGYANIVSEAELQEVPTHVLETASLGINHAEVGHELLRELGLPALYYEVAGRHILNADELKALRSDERYDMLAGAAAASELGEFICGNNPAEALSRMRRICEDHLAMSDSDIEWLMTEVQNDLDQKAAIFSVDSADLQPLGQLVGQARARIGTPPEAEDETAAEAEHLRRENRHLRDLIDMLEAKACRDPLTGIFNRDYFNGRLHERIRGAASHGESFALAVFDIDHFKLINDSLGHVAGDMALNCAARLIDAHFPSGVVARYGGDEFVALLEADSETEVESSLSELCEHVERLLPKQLDASRDTTISAGAVFCRMNGSAEFAPIHLIELADKAMYQSKKAGGNRCSIVTTDDSPDAWVGCRDSLACPESPSVPEQIASKPR